MVSASSTGMDFGFSVPGPSGKSGPVGRAPEIRTTTGRLGHWVARPLASRNFRYRRFVMNHGWKVTSLLAAFAAVACKTKGHENDNANLASTSIAPQPGPQPKFAQAITLETPPPPISGGTLTVAKDGRTVIAADSDRDQIYV